MPLTPISIGMSGSNALTTINACFTKVDTVETNADVTDLTNVGAALITATAKGAIVDADLVNIQDSAAAFAPKTTLWSLVKSTLKTYFDTLYTATGTTVTSITGTANQITVTGTTTPTLSLPSAITGPTSVQLGATGTVGQLIAPSTSTSGMQLRAYNGIDFYNTQYGYSMGNVNGGTWNIANVYCSSGTKSTRMDVNYGFQCAPAATVGWTTASNPSTAPDTALSRVSAGVLGVGTGASGATDGSVLAGSLTTSVALKAGTNGTGIATLKHGTATLTAGTVTVSDSNVAAGSRIFINRQTDGGTVGDSYSITRSAGVSFTITSKTANATVTGDTSTVSYMLINP